MCLVFVACSAPKSEMVEIPLAEGEIRIALIDTGIATDVIGEQNIMQGYNYVSDSQDTQDRVGHGTSVAGILLGSSVTDNQPLIQGITVVPLVIQDEIDGEVITASQDVLAKSIYDAVDVYNCKVINMSLGAEEQDTVLEDAVKYAYDNNVVVVSSVGNTQLIYPDATYYPASYEWVIGVGSVDMQNNVSDFSQVNESVMLMGYGEGYYMAMPGGGGRFAAGTSFATAYVTAAAAKVFFQNEDFTSQEVVDALINNALDIEEVGYDKKSGFGICRQPYED